MKNSDESDNNVQECSSTGVIDGVLSSTQIPNGGYGWLVFLSTLFFHFFIPTLMVVYGVLLASKKLKNNHDKSLQFSIWNNELIYAPLFFHLSWILFDSEARKLLKTTWPRTVGQTGNCLICAGLLFLWIGKIENNNSTIKIWLIFSGILTGIGSSIQMAQCEIILAQYFKSKHLYLSHITQMISALGFITIPILISTLLKKYELFKTILIYQTILLLGFIFNVVFKKPEYLKLKQSNYVMENGVEDEDDIFSKSLTELKLKTDNVLRKIEIKPEAGTSNSPNNRSWIKFDENERENWEKFDESEDYEKPQQKYVVLDELNNDPIPLFNESEVNMNNTYAFDDDEIPDVDNSRSFPSVFPQNERAASSTSFNNLKTYLNILKTPTFYKSLLTLITMKYSIFIFFVLFPSYLSTQLKNFQKAIALISCLSFGSLAFTGFSYWINVNKTKRPIFLFVLCWIGANGYFLVAVYKNSEIILILGALEIVLSISSLQHVGGPLMGLTMKGESNTEYAVLNFFTGIAFFVFLFIDISYKNCFLLMALLQILTGLLWVSNFFYKQIRYLYN